MWKMDKNEFEKTDFFNLTISREKNILSVEASNSPHGNLHLCRPVSPEAAGGRS